MLRKQTFPKIFLVYYSLLYTSFPKLGSKLDRLTVCGLAAMRQYIAKPSIIALKIKHN